MFTEFLIVSLCATATPEYKQACHKATEATMIQTGVSRDIRLIEKSLLDYGNTIGVSLLGKEIWTTTGVLGGIGFKIYRDHELQYRFTTKRYLPFDYVTPSIKGIGDSQQTGGSLGVGWAL